MSPDPSRGKQSRLGKGLSALIGEVEGVGLAPAPDEPRTTDAPSGNVPEFAVSDIRPNPAQPRRSFSEAELEELAASIKTRGVLQPILLRPDPDAPNQFQIVAGERRWRAAQRAGLTTIPAVVRDMDELQLLEVGIIENVQREDLNPIEEAEAYGALIKRFGRTQENLAESVGKSRAHIANTMRLLNLGESAREHLRQGRISAGHARAALGAPDPDPVVDMAVAKGLSVREVESLVKRLKDGGALDTVAKKVQQHDKDVDTEALESDLARVLGLKVDIRQGLKGGELRIKYGDLEQLDELCRRLTAKR
ncbi:MAG: ParB/RepB/Spo0J family partition protein [Hyphomonadaceae bacterium]|nr:ParB/RepB/Spo0J family partition protein [Hyphomonadaceae bacterium]